MTDEAVILMAWEAVSSDAAMAGLLRQLAEAFDCGSAALIYKDHRRPAADIAIAHGPLADAAVQRRYAVEFAGIDPAPAALARLSIGEVGDTDALFPASILHRHREFLDGFYYPLGLAGALGAPLSKGDGRIGMVAVHRSPGRRSFDERDARRLRKLVPHLVRMVELRRTFFALEARAADLDDALKPLTAGVMVLDAGGVIVEANSAARALFARDDGLILTRPGRLLTRDAAANLALQEAFAEGADERVVRVARGDGASPYVLRIRQGREQQGWVVLASDPASYTDDLSTKALRDALGLSASAAEVVVALLDGETLNDFCARRRMSRNTAKYHLRTAFETTGTRRQADLLRHATAIVRDLSLGSIGASAGKARP